MKKICIFLVLVIILLSGSPAGIAANDHVDTIRQSAIDDSYDYYRSCDQAAGKVIEKYDQLLHGDNDCDYFALATSMSESKSDRTAAMKEIIQIYNDVTEQERAHLHTYILQYAPYVNDAEVLAFYDALTTMPTARSIDYNRSAAAAYAQAHYAIGTFSSDYPDLRFLGGDCANFVSQCMYAGGKMMTDRWSIYKRNSTYMAPTNVDQLNYSWVLTDPSPWISAGAFNTYWSGYAHALTYSVPEFETDHDTIFWEDILIGDPFQLMNKVLWWYEAFHTMIVVGYDYTNNDFKYAAHSESVYNGSILNRICSSGAYDDCYIRFFSMD